MKASIITIGDELLIGQVIDTNSAWLGSQLAELDVQVVEILSIQDEAIAIKEAISRGLKNSDLVLMTGGLGPTKDDITKKTIVEYFGDEMYFDEAVYNKIQRFFTRIGKEPLEAHRLQCYMPKSAEILRNKMGTAPGMLFKQEGKILISVPGVPYEMKSIFEDEIRKVIFDERQEGFFYKRTIRTVGKGESQIASDIEDILEQLPSHLKLAYLPGLGQVRIRLSGWGENEESIKREIEAALGKISERLGNLVFGYDDDTLESVVGELLVHHGLTIAFAESCTGGYLSHLITSVPGSSRYMEGSFVTYSYELKEKLLNVNPQTLAKHGAVSEETVIEMVQGCRNTTNSNIAISISGIAGPGGGTIDKPVGTIWLAIANETKQRTLRLSLGKYRKKNIQYTSVHALNLLRKFLNEEY